MIDELDLIGHRIGRYEIRSLLGSGGMGTVYRAYEAALDRQVAIKILPAEFVTDQDRVRRFVQEAKSASALHHPNVISIYDIGQDGSIYYIAMELVEGTTLREPLERGAIDLKRAITIAGEVAGAIGAAHEAGVVHRDLKPENIIIASAGYVKVLDFGLAKLRKELTPEGVTEVRSTESGVVLGTAGYMSPEQAAGKTVDHRSDIFSLGCILYEMVSGRAPFDGDSALETMFNIIHAEPAALEAPQELKRIVTKALAKSPDDRYQSAKDLVVDLKASLRSGAAGSQPAGGSFGGLRARRSTIAIVTALLAIIAAFVVLLRPRGRKEEPLTIQRITTNGNTIAAAISPDGKYVAYVNAEGGQQSLWLRQLATRQDLQLIAPAEVSFWGHAFSPDVASIYYAVKSTEHLKGTLYGMSILGGRAQKILDGIDSGVTFSPDGKKIAYVRAENTAGESSLVVANADGSDIRVLAKRRAPQSFYPPIFTAPAWSPDGKRIAAALMERPTADVNRSSVIEVDAATGQERVISSGWVVTQQVAWMPDGSGLIVVGEYHRNQSNPQLWFLPMPSGEPRPITNDLSDYRMASVTADGSTLVSVYVESDADLWLVPLDASAPPRKLRAGKGVGAGGLSVARDGSIAYASLDSGNFDLWIADADGSNARRLTTDSHRKQNPRFTPDGKTIIFTGYGKTTTISRIAADGSQKQPALLYQSTSEPPALSPDGQTLVFHTTSGLVKAPLSGGTMTPLTNYRVQRPAISPDGTRIAGYCVMHEGEVMQICVIPMSGGAPEKTFQAAAAMSSSVIRWTDDGRALLLNTMPSGRANIWLFPLDGRAPKQLTNFPDQLLFRFDVTPDRKAFIVSRGELSRDAVMITGFR